MSKVAPRLGRGLSTLISTPSETPAAIAPPHDERDRADGILRLAVSRIRPSPHQPRKTFDDAAIHALAESIKTSGVLQPVIVRRGADGQFELVAGERRWRAAAAAGLETVPAIVRQVSDSQAVELALIENLQREDLGPLDRAQAYRQYIDLFKVTPEELSQRIGESRANVSNYLRLLRLHADIQELIRTGQLGMGQARAIAGIDDPERQLAMARLTVRRNLAVRQVEAIAKTGAVSRETAREQPAVASRHVTEVQDSLSRALGLHVRLLPGKKKNSGRIVISYDSLEEFDRIAERIQGRTMLD